MFKEFIYIVKYRVEAILWYRTTINIALKLLKPVLQYILSYFISNALFNRPPVVLYGRFYYNSHLNHNSKVGVELLPTYRFP